MTTAILEKKTPISAERWPRAQSGQSATTGTSQSASQTAETRKARATVGWACPAIRPRGGFHRRRALAVSVPAADVKRGRAGTRADPSDDAGGEHDQREWHGEEEDATKARRPARASAALQARGCRPGARPASTIASTAAFKPKNSAATIGTLPYSGVNATQRHDRDDAGHDEQAAGDDRPRPAVHQPADIGGELLSLRAGQQHAVAQRVQKPALADPFLLVDDDPVHHRDLARRSAERQRGDPQPDPERLAERDAVAGIGRVVPMEICDTGCPYGLPAGSSCGARAGSCGTTRRARRT